MDKSPEAFRTISEVAEALDTPAHVLRFWESRFPQIRPVKRAGGRRYYRPSDIALLSGIKRLLHDEGLTIRGVQKILREQGIRHVARLGSGGAVIPEDDGQTIEAQLTAALGVDDTEPLPATEAETAQIIALESVLARVDRIAPVRTDPLQGTLFADQVPKPAQDAPPPPEDAPEAPMVEMAEDDADTGWPDEAAHGAVVPLSAPAAAQGADPAHPAAAPVESDATDAAPTLAARLRSLPKGALARHDAQLGDLRVRLHGLRARLAEAARRRAR